MSNTIPVRVAHTTYETIEVALPFYFHTEDQGEPSSVSVTTFGRVDKDRAVLIRRSEWGDTVDYDIETRKGPHALHAFAGYFRDECKSTPEEFADALGELRAAVGAL